MSESKQSNLGTIVNLIAAVATVFGAFWVHSIGVRQNDINRCFQRVGLANEIVELVSSISNAVIYNIGIPDTCYAKRDGSPTFHQSTEAQMAAEEYNQDSDKLLFKIQPLILLSKAINDRIYDFQQAIMGLEKQCKASEDFDINALYKAQSIVKDSASKLIATLGASLKNCYE